MFLKGKGKKEKGLKIIIVGCGKVGEVLAGQLSSEGHDVSVIDKDKTIVNDIADAYDVMGYVGNGGSYMQLKEAGIDEADLIIAVTESDELNLLCCTIARQAGHCSAIARVRNPEYSDEAAYLSDKLDLALIINPEHEAATEIARILALPTAIEIDTFANKQVELIKIKIPEGNVACNKTIAELDREYKFDVLICGAQRDGEVFIPDGGYVIKAGDEISFIGSRDVSKDFILKMGLPVRSVADCMIVGGGRVAYYLGKQLINMGMEVKIIENDEKRCERLTELLPDAIVINGDGTDENVLNEAGLAHTQAFVPLTGIDEENIMLSLYAGEKSDAKLITKINHSAFHDVIAKMDLGSVIYPKYITAEAIIGYVRAMKDSKSRSSEILALYHLFDNRAEAIEFKIAADSGVTGIPLKDLKLKDNLLIAIIRRDEKIIIPGGFDTLLTGDEVVIITTHQGLCGIEDILK